VVLPRGARQRASAIAEQLEETFPGSATELCALSHDDPFQLLVATILSAQCTDERVNQVVPKLFAEFSTPEQLAAADRARVEQLIHSTGFFRSKTQSLIGMAQALLDRYGGEVPTEMHELVTLPGVGRKTANVIRSVAFGLPGLPVDTHVGRLARRLRLSNADDPVKVEADLCELVPPSQWGALSLRLILHGRATCDARRPRCADCCLAPWCPSAASGGVVRPSSKRRRSAAGRPKTREAAARGDKRPLDGEQL
jgi:endonuclease-3